MGACLSFAPTDAVTGELLDEVLTAAVGTAPGAATATTLGDVHVLSAAAVDTTTGYPLGALAVVVDVPALDTVDLADAAGEVEVLAGAYARLLYDVLGERPTVGRIEAEADEGGGRTWRRRRRPSP